MAKEYDYSVKGNDDPLSLVKTTAYLYKKDHKEIKQIALDENKKMAEVIRDAVSEYLDKHYD
ncbi:ribbon-helix-helix CopG family protein [Orenia metallireducens]|uniref:Ribbon-helix-helix protein, copG family n=2 Tax=Orenia TaxID=46468 RepID=A0A285IFV2_9FIRM|nr:MULTISPECIES: ribbon-helix-helix protein, CopG family [Orenia]PRX20162.1 ribbon-helix-helix CopG family protein [Orenia metallireducens]TDX48824.1 ribbon-helix-helix CopG family protein [Orenia marismortui]SNY45821.1 Ribbon-helix-helix protein, copG family [Orenia metallireducens]